MADAVTLTWQTWAVTFLSHLGAPTSHENVVAVLAWMASENADGNVRYQFNPLNSTLRYNDSLVGSNGLVMQYYSFDDGIAASVATLQENQPGYDRIRFSLATSTDPHITAGDIRSSAWGSQPSDGLVDQVTADFGRYAGYVVAPYNPPLTKEGALGSVTPIENPVTKIAGGITSTLTDTFKGIEAVGHFFYLLTQGSTWKRVGLVLGGAALVIGGTVVIVKDQQ